MILEKLIGQRFHRWTAIAIDTNNGKTNKNRR